jgi:4a-hydroxytetrahydrobiopterin dehydratase
VITMRPSLIPKLRPLSLISCAPNQSARHFSILITHTSRQATSTAQHQLSRPLNRRFTSTTAKSTTMAGNPGPQFSANADPATLETSLSPLLVTNGGRWSLAMEGQALEREFKFKTFAKTWVSELVYQPTSACPLLFIPY